MRCSEIQEQLTASLEGMLPAAKEQAVRAHLQDCPACRSELAELQALQGRLADDAAALAKPAVESAAMDAILRRQVEEIRRLKMHRLNRYIASGLAAVAALVLIGFVLMAALPNSSAHAAEAADLTIVSLRRSI